MTMKRFLLGVLLTLTLGVRAYAERYPDAAVILLKDREYARYEADGTSETVDECSYRIMNYAGLLEMRQLEMGFNSAYGTLEVTGLAITKPDGRRIEPDPGKLTKIGIDPEQMNSRIYDPAHRQLVLRVPDLEVGDTLDVVIRRRTVKARIPGEWSDICVLQADFPILDYEYTVDAPEEKPLRSIAVKDGIPGTLDFTERRADGRILYRWTARKVPQAFPEPAMPTLHSCCQRVLVSTVKQWQDISRWYDRLCAPRLAAVNAAMRRKVAELVAGKKLETDRIDALFRFVSQEIRYTGITDEEQAPGYEPHDVALTFDRGHGVCRDKAALLTAMLRLAGTEAYMVLFMAGTPKDAEVPNINFNHAIVAAVVGGEYVLMDPTSETVSEWFPSYLAGESYLVARPEGETLRTAPPTPAEKNLLTITTDAALDASGELTGRIDAAFTGFYDQAYRSAIAEWSEAEIRNCFTARLRRELPGAQLKSVAVRPEAIRDMSRPLEVTLEFSAPAPAGELPGVRLPALPQLARSLGLLDSLYQAAALNRRRFPLRTMPRAVRERITVRLPDTETVVALPESVRCERPGVFQFRSDWRREDRAVTLESRFAVDAMRVAPADYPALKQALARVAAAGRALPLLAPELTAADADSLLLEHRETCTVHDDHAWDVTSTVKRKILNYAGVAAHAELRVPYLDGVDTVEIRGSVTAPDGTRSELAAKELNRMDAPGAAAMPRYPRRKVAVASFPGVKIGSVVEYTVVRQYRKRAGFRHRFLFRTHTPARLREITFAGDLRHVQWDWPADPAVRKREERTATGSTFTLTAVDQPAILRETGTPPPADFAPGVLAATAPDHAAWTRALNAQVAAADVRVAETAREIAAGKSGLAAADAIRKYVAARVRAVDYPLEFQLPDHLSAPQLTLADGYGSSADRAILLAALLKAAGVRYEFVFAADRVNLTGRPLAPEWSSVLLALPEHPGYFLNDTGLHGALGAVRGAGRPLLTAAGTREVLTPARPDGVSLRCAMTIQPDGDVTATLVREYRGNDFEGEAERFARFTAETRRRHFEALASAVAPDAEIVSAAADFAGYPGRVTLQLRLPGYARRSGDFVRCPLPGFEMLRRAAATPGARRKLPYHSRATERSCEYTVTFPETWRLRDPETGADEPGTARGRAVIRRRFSAPEKILSPGEYEKRAATDRYFGSPAVESLLFTVK